MSYRNKEWLEYQYLALKRKVVDLAKEANVNRITINRWLKKHNIPSRKFSKEILKKMSNKRMGQNTGENNHNWKGDNVSYASLHTWVRKYKTKPNKCEDCKNPQEYLELANISGEYKRDINDYKYLCVRCHKIMDGNLQKLIDSGKNTRFKKDHKNKLKNGVTYH